MDEKLLMRVIENIDTVKDKRATLTYQLDHVTMLQKQVTSSRDEACAKVKQHMDEAKQALLEIVNKREQTLLQQIQLASDRELEALGKMEQELHPLLFDSVELMDCGKSILVHAEDAVTERSKADVETFLNKAQENNLEYSQWIPQRQDVVCLHVDLPGGLAQEVSTKLQEYGTVFSRAPVEILEVEQRPGGLYVEWNTCDCVVELDHEHISLILNEFRLQLCPGDPSENKELNAEFVDVYQGEDLCFELRGLTRHKTYSLRVCGRAEGSQVWQHWSIPLQVSTSLQSYGLSAYNKSDVSYVFTNDGETVEKVSDGSSIVTCEGHQSLQCGHSVQFKILQTGSPELEGGVFITNSVQNLDPTILPRQHNTLLVNTEGQIFVNGVEKTTNFPEFNTNATVLFQTEPVDSDTIRVDVEYDDKWNASFDWKVESCDTSVQTSALTMAGGFLERSQASNEKMLYYGALFGSTGWKVKVQ